MCKIVFRIYPMMSHLNATIRVAQMLKDDGHDIYYIGIDKFRDYITMQGFNYHTISRDLVLDFRTQYQLSKKLCLAYSKKKHMVQNYIKGYLDFFRFDELSELNPDLVFLDMPYSRYAFELYANKVKFLLIQTMMPNHKSNHAPPLNSSFVPFNSVFSIFVTKVLWLNHQLQAILSSFLNYKIYGAPMFQSLIRTKAAKCNFPISQIDFQRFHHIGFFNVKELILPPKEFEFPNNKPRNNQYFLNFGPTLSRKEINYDFKYKCESRSIIKRKSKFNNLQIVYCSLGSVPYHYAFGSKFYETLIDCFRRQPDWILILAIGIDLEVNPIRCPYENIYIYQKVPQLEVLSYVDLMITHGGMNSITECIINRVPMLVYPTGNADQHGNAARVCYHKIGEKGNIRYCSSGTLYKQVRRVLNSIVIKRNLNRMYDNLLENNNPKITLEKIIGL